MRLAADGISHFQRSFRDTSAISQIDHEIREQSIGRHLTCEEHYYTLHVRIEMHSALAILTVRIDQKHARFYLPVEGPSKDGRATLQCIPKVLHISARLKFCAYGKSQPGFTRYSSRCTHVWPAERYDMRSGTIPIWFVSNQTD